MDLIGASQNSPHVYRVDKFIVPTAARGEFLERVFDIHTFLRTQQGVVQDFILEPTGGPGRFNLVTIVIWESPHAVEAARAAAAERYRKIGFDPTETLRRLGIDGDLANYAEDRHA